MPRTTPDPSGAAGTAGQRGHALLAFTALAAVVGLVIDGQLGAAIAERQQLRDRSDRIRARCLAAAEMERAKNVVNASGYVGGDNLALGAALAADPPRIADTGVSVRRLGGADSQWFVLHVRRTLRRAVGEAQVFVRQRPAGGPEPAGGPPVWALAVRDRTLTPP